MALGRGDEGRHIGLLGVEGRDQPQQGLVLAQPAVELKPSA
jgi:hypothetical protein